MPAYLDIDISQLGPNGIESLSRVRTRFNQLRLHGGIPSAALMRALVANPYITEIRSHEGPIAPEALAILKGARNIRVLWLSERDLPEDYLTVVTTLPNLVDLQISPDDDWAAIHIYRRHNVPGMYCEVRKEFHIGSKELSALKSINNLTGMSFTGELSAKLAKEFLRSQPRCRIEVKCIPRTVGRPGRVHYYLKHGELVREETYFDENTRMDN
jgi:hypothetical protein